MLSEDFCTHKRARLMPPLFFFSSLSIAKGTRCYRVRMAIVTLHRADFTDVEQSDRKMPVIFVCQWKKILVFFRENVARRIKNA